MKAAAACLLILLTTTVVAVTAAFFFFYYIVVWLESIFGKLGSLFVMETTGGMLYSLRNGNRRSKDHSLYSL